MARQMAMWDPQSSTDECSLTCSARSSALCASVRNFFRDAMASVERGLSGSFSLRPLLPPPLLPALPPRCRLLRMVPLPPPAIGDFAAAIGECAGDGCLPALRFSSSLSALSARRLEKIT